MVIVVVVTAAAAQSWFAGGGAIANGDIVAPAGTAWLAHLFSPWTWSGSNLGGPGAGALALPWAIIDAGVHALGGSGALAQRVWLTGLFAGVGAGGVALLTELELGTMPAVTGGLIYAFSAYVVVDVGANDVFLATLGLVPALMAWVIAIARARRMRWWLVAMVPAAAMLGVVAENPPMVLACAAALLVSPILVAWLYGGALARIALRRTLLGIGVLVAASAYWAVPFAIQLYTTSLGQAGVATSWAWTEGRATLANAFWLNDSWSWAFPIYFPYEHWYQQFPLAFAKYLLPVAAFASLGVGGLRTVGRDASRLRLIAASSSLALALVFLSTGTRFPGSFIFNLLYSLPYGWLLQEPGRFLFGTGLAYAVLIAIGMESATASPSDTTGETGSRVPNMASAVRRFRLVPVIAIALLLLPGLPLMTGSVVPGARSPFPSEHVALPGYWGTMTTFVNKAAPPGNVLVLPEDDFYQMPYSWYYGSDGFIINMIARNVVDPAGQGYSAASGELLGAVGLLQRSLVAHNWRQVVAVAQILGTRDVLVRGDIESNFPSRDIANPATLASALAVDPDVQLVDRAGPLDLFAFRQAFGPLTRLATVNSRTPDLRLLSLLPSGSALVTSPPRPGIPALIQLSPIVNWTIRGTTLTTSVPLPAHRNYEVTSLTGLRASQFVPLSSAATVNAVQFREYASAHGTRMLASLPVGHNLIPDGAFASGKWGPVGNCDDVDQRNTKAPIAAHVEPNGGPNGSRYLALFAAADGACESTPVSWSSGPVLISLKVRFVSGAPPRLCLWEAPSSGHGRCASALTLPAASKWTTYTTEVDPPANVQKLKLFLYGDWPPTGAAQTVDDYADVQVHQLATPSDFAVMAEPVASRNPPFVTDSVSYSSHWDGPPASTHVLVDGMENGWIGSKPLDASRPHYVLVGIITVVDVATVVAVGAVVVLLVADAIRRRYRRIAREQRRARH